jgi:hypothetical protein
MTALSREERLKKDLPAPPADALIFEHLGIAVMLCWAELPFKVRDQILNQANDMMGITPIPGIRDQIVRLLLRHRKV